MSTPVPPIQWESGNESSAMMSEVSNDENCVSENVELSNFGKKTKQHDGALQLSQVLNMKENHMKKMKTKSKKSKVQIEKRPMIRLAETEKIIGKEADNLFNNSVDMIKQKVIGMNHATRFWLGVKFFRLNKLDFQQEKVMEIQYSMTEIGKLLGISRYVILKFVQKIPKNESILNLMRSKRYMSPVECNPLYYESYFKKYASNYIQLKADGIFHSRK